MTKERLENLPTTELLNLAKLLGNPARHSAEKALLTRWKRGDDLELLCALLQSDRSNDRLLAAYYLGEISGPVKDLEASVIKLSHDPLSDCRRAFVTYAINSNSYNEPIGVGLAKCLMDLHLYVRIAALDWGVRTSSESLAAFSKLVEAGTGWNEPKFGVASSDDFWNDSSQKRADRGLAIVRGIRAGEEIESIRKWALGEDSFVMDWVQFARKRHQRVNHSRE